MELVEARRGIAARVVALTFDDGPSPWTEPIAEQLERHGGRGTFFAIGEEVDTDEGRASSAVSSREATVGAVGLILEEMARRGLRSVTVTELLASS
jgi:peptidoglycan/xylan/chitin deacetylase (PgdA/CDA1 family)